MREDQEASAAENVRWVCEAGYAGEAMVGFLVPWNISL